MAVHSGYENATTTPYWEFAPNLRETSVNSGDQRQLGGGVNSGTCTCPDGQSYHVGVVNLIYKNSS